MSAYAMTLDPVRSGPPSELEINGELVTILDLLCQEIELPSTRIQDAKNRYNTIGGLLARKDSALFPFSPRVFAQGSTEIGTANRPLRTYEFDVDLACLCTARPPWTPVQLQERVFQELNQDGRYKGKVRKLSRCIQLAYADEFHLDIMPCIPRSDNGSGILLPDKKATFGWGPTHPEGYSFWFKNVARELPMRPKRAMLENRESGQVLMSANSQVDPFPEWNGVSKQPLQRCVQLIKRHRDRHFYEDDSKSPASIIVTTLAARSYEQCVKSNTYEHAVELLLDIVDGMLKHVHQRLEGSRLYYTITNPVLPSENFASKWSEDSAFPTAFYDWHKKVASDLRMLRSFAGQGISKLGNFLDDRFGASAGSKAVRKLSENVHNMTKTGSLGIITRPSSGSSIIRSSPTTFFGQ